MKYTDRLSLTKNLDEGDRISKLFSKWFYLGGGGVVWGMTHNINNLNGRKARGNVTS